MHVSCASYTGTGAALTITEPGFAPDWIFFFTAAGIAYCWVTTMGTAGKPLTGSTAPVASVLNAAPSGSGFVVGTASAVNTLGTIYHYVCGQNTAGEAKAASYTGNGVDPHAITGVGFAPNLVLTLAATAQPAVMKTSDIPNEVSSADTTSMSLNGGVSADRIQSFDADGFTVGLTNSVNQNAQTIHYLALKNVASVFAVFTYAGTNAAHSVGASLGFTPHAALVKRSTSVPAAFRGRNHTGLRSTLVDGSGAGDTQITGLISDGITVGTGTSANGTGATLYGLAFSATDGDGSGPTDPAAAASVTVGTLSLLGVG